MQHRMYNLKGLPGETRSAFKSLGKVIIKLSLKNLNFLKAFKVLSRLHKSFSDPFILWGTVCVEIILPIDKKNLPKWCIRRIPKLFVTPKVTSKHKKDLF